MTSVVPLGTDLTVRAAKPSRSTTIMELLNNNRKMLITVTDVTIPIELPGQATPNPHRD